jgi:glycosyltransferase involved in cell wall biosynthesis
MKILFDLRRVGLGNNGGSLTIISSANILSAIGHDVKIIDGGRNQHTWKELKVEHLIPKTVDKIPNADVVIATGYKSVIPTVRLPKRCGLKTHWIRGWETWSIPENKIVSEVLKQPTIKLVNGLCLQEKLKSFGYDSYLVRPGYDLELYRPLNKRGKGELILLGGLYNQKHSKIKRHDWIFRVINILKENKVLLLMYGADNDPKRPEIYRYRKQPTPQHKNAMYNAVDMWLAPTMQEGLHMPPAEAMLTECPVIGTDAPMSGMKDYLVHKETGLVSKNNFDDFFMKTMKLVNDPELRKEYGKNARKKIMEIGDRFKNMRNMVKTLEKII